MSLAIRPIGDTGFSYGHLGHLEVIVDENGYMNATKLGQKVGKELKKWTRLAGTKSFKQAAFDQLQSSGGHMWPPEDLDREPTVADLEYIHSGGRNREINGTYLHPDLMIQYAMWCSDEYGLFVTRVMREYHGREAKKERKELRCQLNKKRRKIDRLEQMMAEIREENARYREEAEERERKAEERERKAEERARQAEEERREAERKAERHARRTHAQLDTVQSDLGDVKEELVDVKGELGHVSRKLGVAKHQRVPPPRDPQSVHRLVVLRLGPKRRTKDGKMKKAQYSHSIHRVQEKSLSASLASKRRDYPRAEVILDLETPNSMNLFNRFKEKYSRRIDWDGIYVLPIGTYDESKLIRDLKKLHEKRMTDASLE